MKLLLWTAVRLLLFGVSAIPLDEWNQYKAEHNKVYTSEEENTRRLQQYMKSKEIMEEHNRNYERGETSFEMGINKFSDWFPEEIDRMLGLKSQEGGLTGEKFLLPPGGPVPDSINWVEKGAVTKVKFEGCCFSSYAFAAAGALEGLMFIANKTISDLSVQELVDCVYGDYEGCCGGLPTDCFNYVINRKGIDTDESYPYEATPETCRADNGKVVASCTSYKTGENENDLKSAVGTVGPVAFAFAVSMDFVFYKSGVYDDSCCMCLNHWLLAVGYNKDNTTGQDYWLVKNSWGTDWGENGYARIVRGVNKCGIGNNWSYPIYKPKTS